MSDDFDDIPLAEITDERVKAGLPRPRRGSSRRAWIVSLVCVVVVAAVAVPLALSRRTNDHEGAKVVLRTDRAAVGDAVARTIAASNFNFRATLNETTGSGSAPTIADPCPPPTTAPPGDSFVYLCASADVGYGETHGLPLASHGTMNLDPFAMRASSDVPGLGDITTYVNDTTIWEIGGGNYGATDGQPLSGFASLVEGTLGPREGAVSMMSLANPNGYVNIALDAITDASKVGTRWDDGFQLTDYEVTMDAARLIDRPGMSTEQAKTSSAALVLLQQQGYTNTTVRVAVDSTGLIHETATTVHFADGGSVNATASLSDFGCTNEIVFPGQTPTPTTASPTTVLCDTSEPSTSTPPTTATASSTTVPSVGGAPVHVQGTFKGVEHYAYQGRCPELTHDLVSKFTLDGGTVWDFHAEYCGTVQGTLWSGSGTFVFTLPDAATLTGRFADSAELPSKGVPYTLQITGGTAQFAGATGACPLDNHLHQSEFGVQDQYGTFTCDVLVR